MFLEKLTELKLNDFPKLRVKVKREDFLLKLLDKLEKKITAQNSLHGFSYPIPKKVLLKMHQANFPHLHTD